MKAKRFKKSEIDKALRVVQRKLADGTISTKEFDMGTSMETRCDITIPEHWCGSAGCIGGWTAIELKVAPNEFVYASDPNFLVRDGVIDHNHLYSKATAKKLSPLFYPYREENWKDFTPGQAVLAIERYFNGNINPWKGIRA